jgi:hemin uptake protein HemP
MTKEAIKSIRDFALIGGNGGIQTVEVSRRVVRSRDLLGDEDSVTIEYNGKLYVLSSLPSGRLVLTGSNPGHGGRFASRFPVR